MFLKSVAFSLLIFYLQFSCAEFVSILVSGLVVGGSWYNWNIIKDNTYCKLAECCNDDYIPYDLDKLKQLLSERMFGQPLVNELVNIIAAHKESIYDKNKQNKKALVISLHGWSGVGKNYASSIIAESLYKEGMNSKYVMLLMGKKDFDCTDLNTSKVLLRQKINSVVKNCPRSLIIFDEIHDMCPTVLDAIKPMLDHHQSVDGVDYRDSIFIFISNIGGQEIATSLLELYSSGVKRNDVEFHNFEPIIRRTAYYTGYDWRVSCGLLVILLSEAIIKSDDEQAHAFSAYANKRFSYNFINIKTVLVNSGFEKSATIAQHLIDHYIPFLPMEQQHVELCARAEFRSHGVFEPTKEMMKEALTIVTYGPTETQPIFANNGCKRFTRHIPYIIHKYKRKSEL